MHSVSTITQRAQPATRAKTRWQPYTSTPATSAALLSRSPSSLSLNTPIFSVASPRPTVNATSDPPRPRQSQPNNPPASTAQTPKDSIQREGSKYKFAVGLIDQAVKTLSDLWRPHDIPRVFLAPQKGAAIPTSASTHSTPISSKVQQPPLAKSTHPSSPDSPSTQPAPAPAPTLVPSQRPPQVLVASDSESDLLPLRSFVHEVLKRSRTSGSILQTALCYLEAVRPKIAEILRDEKQGIRNLFQPETRILPATEAELVREAELSSLDEASGDVVCSDECMKTIRVMDQDEDETIDVETQSTSSSLIVEPSIAAGPSSTLPSPLLCPRRAFLASLILASKFSQDKCYSNRAWAKLSGLPPREIGRCERALGQALDWRLWVGKVASTSVTSTSTPPIRTVVRTQSESSIGSPSASRTPFLVPQEPIPPAPVAQQQQQDALSAPTSVPAPIPTPLGGASHKRLRKSTTLPADSFAFAASRQAPTTSVVAPALDSGVYCDASTPASTPGLSAYQIGPTDMDIVDDIDVFDARKQDLQASPFFRSPFCPTEQNLTPASWSELSLQKIGTPIPDTPSLTYSPSSTDSAGDRTIQMTSFEDGGFPTCPSSQSWIDVTLATSSASSSCSSSTLAPEQHYGLLGAPSVKTASPTPMTTPLPFVVAHRRNHKAKRKAYLSRAASGVAFDLAMAARRAAEGVGDPMITVVTDAEAVPPFGSSRMGHYLWHADSGITVEPTGVH